MSNKGTIGAKIVLDGEKEYKQAVTNINNAMKTMKSELKLASAEFKENANTAEALAKKHGILAQQLDTQKQKVQAYKDALKNSSDNLTKCGENVDKWKDSLEQAKQKLEEMKKSQNSTNEELDQQKKAVDDAKAALKQAETQYTQVDNRTEKWKQSLNNAQAELFNMDSELHKNESYLEEAKSSTDGCASSIDQFGKATKESKSGMDRMANALDELAKNEKQAGDQAIDLGDIIKGNLASQAIVNGVGKLKDTIGDLKEQITEFTTSSTKALNDFSAKTGTTGKSLDQFGKAMKDVYADNFGEDMGDIASTMSTIKQNVNNIDAKGMKDAAENSLLLRDTFGFETEESIRSVKMLMDTFHLSAKQAYNMVAQGAQNGLDKNQDLLDTINEYSVHFKKLGFSSTDMFNMLVNGAKDGTFSVDKLGDAVKEFGIRAKDGTADDAFKKLGLNAKELKKQFNAGGDEAKKASQKVMTAFAGMKSKSDQYLVGQKMFGTMFEDLGTDAIECLMNVDGKVSTTKDALKQINDVKYDDLQTNIEGLGRKVLTKFGDKFSKAFAEANDSVSDLNNNFKGSGVEKAVDRIAGSAAEMSNGFLTFATDALPKVADGLNFLVQHGEEVKTAMAGVAAAFVMYKAVTQITAVVTALKTAKQAAIAAETSTKLLNLAFAASPAGVIATGVGLLTAGILAFVGSSKKGVEHTSKLDQELDKLNEKVKEVNDNIDQANKTYGDSYASATGTANAYKDMADKLYDLNDKEKKSNADKKLMAKYVAELNKQYPNLNIAIDEQTGKLNTQKEKVYDVIDALKKQALQEATMSLYKSVYEEQAKAVLAQKDAQEAYNKTHKEYKTAKEASDKAEKEYTEWYNSHGKVVDQDRLQKAEELKTKTEEKAEADKKAEKALDKTNTTVKKANAEVKKLDKTIGSADGYEKLGADAEKSGEKTKKASKKHKEAADETSSSAKKTAKDVKDSSDKAKKSVDDSTDGIKKSVSTKGKEASTTFDKLVKAMAKSAKDNLNGKKSNELGSNYLQGLINGMNGKKGLLFKTVSGVAQAIIDKTKTGLDEHSPSKIAHSLGGYWGEGLANGISGSKTSVDGAVDKINNAIKKISTTTMDSEVKKASKKAKEALKKAADQYEKDLNTYQTKIADVIKNAEDKIKDYKGNYNSQLKSKTDSIYGAYGLFDSTKSDEQYDPTTLLNNLKEQTETLNNWRYNLDTLKDKGFSNTLIKELENLGPQAAGQIEALTKMTGDQVAQYNKLYKQKKKIASQEATEELQELKKQTEKNCDKVIEAAQKKITAANKKLKKQAASLGKNVSDGMAEGIEKSSKNVTTAGKKLAKALEKEVKKQLGIHSPSRVMRESGQYTGEGLALGMEDKIQRIQQASKAMADSSVRTVHADYQMSMSQANNSSTPVIADIDYDRLAKTITQNNGNMVVELDGEKMGLVVDSRLRKVYM